MSKRFRTGVRLPSPPPKKKDTHLGCPSFLGSGSRGVEPLKYNMPVAYCADSAHVVGHSDLCRRQRCSLTNPRLVLPSQLSARVSLFLVSASRGESNCSNTTCRGHVVREGLTERHFYFRSIGTKMQIDEPEPPPPSNHPQGCLFFGFRLEGSRTANMRYAGGISRRQRARCRPLLFCPQGQNAT